MKFIDPKGRHHFYDLFLQDQDPFVFCICRLNGSNVRLLSDQQEKKIENCLLWHIQIAAAFIPVSTVKCIEDFEEPLAMG